MVAYADDLAPGEVTALRYWGTDLVLWRDEAGEHHLQDAYCPHLGAHLGVGGKVQGATLECPFHGWTYDGAGACTNIPYSQRENRKAKLRTYPGRRAQRDGLRVAPPRRRRAAVGGAGHPRDRRRRVERDVPLVVRDQHGAAGDGRERRRPRALPLRARHRGRRGDGELRARRPAARRCCRSRAT